MNYIAVEQIERLARQDHLLSLDRAKLVDADPGRLSGVRSPLVVFERKNFSTVRLGLEHRLFEMLEEPLGNLRAGAGVDRGDLKLNAGFLSVLRRDTQQHDVALAALLDKPDTVF